MSATADASLSLILVAHHVPGHVGVVRSLLEREGYGVLCAYDGRVARHYIEQHRPALLLLDQALPLVDGFELCRSLRRDRDAPAIFIMSDQPDELNKLLAFSAGADDYLPLPMHPRELLGRVKVALRWTSSRADRGQSVVRCGRIELHTDERQARAAGTDLPLTSLEYELLALFVRHPGRVFARDEMLSRLSGFLRGEPLDRAVDIHVSNLRYKLRQVMGEDVPIETVRGVGYRLRREEPASAPADAVGASAGGGLERLALAALERAPIPLLALSSDRTVLLYNEAAQRLCGWTTDEVVGQAKCYSLLGCHNADGTLLCHDACPMRQGLGGGVDDHQTHYRITLKDGRELSVAAHYSRLTTGSPHDDCVLLVLQPEGEQTPAPA
jgi:DNA-binding response OmpR family regulator